jgi:hypothetical protein
VLDERVGLFRPVEPADHGVDLQADVGQAEVRVRLVLGGHDHRPPAGLAHRDDRLERPGEQRRAGDPELGVQLPVPVGDGEHLVGREPEGHLLLELRTETVDDDLGVDRDPRLGRDRPERRRDPRPRVDQRHVEIEPHHRPLGHGRNLTVTPPWEGLLMSERSPSGPAHRAESGKT